MVQMTDICTCLPVSLPFIHDVSAAVFLRLLLLDGDTIVWHR